MLNLAPLILATAAFLHRGTPSPAVVDAIASECAAEAEAHPVDPRMCAALVTVFAAHESGFRTGVFGDSGRSFGLLQEPAAIARKLTTRGQVRWWLDTLRRGSLAGLCGNGPAAARIARHRVAVARASLAASGAAGGR